MSAALEFGDARIPSRIWAKIVVEDSGCWAWQGVIAGAGYGKVRFGKGMAWVHRVMLAASGTDLTGLVVDHLCRNRVCCNPAHLEAVTQRENLRRGSRGVLCVACPQGHAYDAVNTRIGPGGKRACRACGRERERRRRVAALVERNTKESSHV